MHCSRIFIVAATLSVAPLALTGCGGSSAEAADPNTAESVASIQAQLRFHKVVVRPFSVASSVEEPGFAPLESHRATVQYLADKGVFAVVYDHPAAPVDPDTLIVDGQVEGLRIVGGSARMWGGAMAGNSYMNVKLVAMDMTGAPVAEQVVSSDNNAMAAAWTGGANDRSLPADMGPILGDAIIQMAKGSGTPAAAAPVAPAAAPTTAPAAVAPAAAPAGYQGTPPPPPDPAPAGAAAP
ncbi:MAG: DUF4410 domain-containing protein [Polyangiaceae bacterium]|nr:DUF4410 domain-containing protein [Polyangiaceae bacterium]